MRDPRTARIKAAASDVDNNSAAHFARTLSRAFSYSLAATPRRRRGEVGYLNLRLGEYTSQLIEDDYGFALVLYHLRHKDKAFRRADDAYVMIRATRPEPRHGRAREVKTGEKNAGLRTFTVIAPKMIEEKSVLAFFIRHRARLGELKLRGSEDIGITSDTIRFRWVGNNVAELYPRFLAFAHLVREITCPTAPEGRLFTREWRLKPTAKATRMNSEALHSFGGKLKERIKCPHCDSATNLMAQIDFSDPKLPKTPLGRRVMPVFWCLNCCEGDWTFFDIARPTPKPQDDYGKNLKLSRINDGEDDLPERPVALVQVPSGKKSGRKSKIGGAPTWIQLDDAIDCPRCEKPMAFVLQLASNSYFEFHDMGLLYVFVCPECKVTGSLVQSH